MYKRWSLVVYPQSAGTSWPALVVSRFLIFLVDVSGQLVDDVGILIALLLGSFDVEDPPPSPSGTCS